MNAMRRGVAEHMRRSLDTSAHDERDRGRHVARHAARERLKKEYESAYGVNPTYLAFVTKAAIETLRDWPWINGEIRGQDRDAREREPGIGALEDKGLIVPGSGTRRTSTCSASRARSPTSPSGPARRSSCPTTSRAARSRSRPRRFGTFHGTDHQPAAGRSSARTPS